MKLSASEARRLHEIAASLEQEDPTLAAKLTGPVSVQRHKARWPQFVIAGLLLAATVLGIISGIRMITLGIYAAMVLGIAAFLVFMSETDWSRFRKSRRHG